MKLLGKIDEKNKEPKGLFKGVNLKATLRSWYQEYRDTGSVTNHGNWDAILKYSHREMAHKYLDLLDYVLRVRRNRL